MTATPDAWGLTPAIPDPPPIDVEIGVTTDGDGWAPIPQPHRVTRTDFAAVVGVAGLSKLRYLIIKHGWHRRRL